MKLTNNEIETIKNLLIKGQFGFNFEQYAQIVNPLIEKLTSLQRENVSLAEKVEDAESKPAKQTGENAKVLQESN